MIVTVTGLKVKSFWRWPAFWRHAVPALKQCQKAEGCLFVETFSRDGVMHTVTVFESVAHLKSFSRSGAHKKASKAFRRIADGKIFSWQCEVRPSREEAMKIWQENAKWY